MSKKYSFSTTYSYTVVCCWKKTSRKISKCSRIDVMVVLMFCVIGSVVCIVLDSISFRLSFVLFFIVLFGTRKTVKLILYRKAKYRLYEIRPRARHT